MQPSATLDHEMIYSQNQCTARRSGADTSAPNVAALTFGWQVASLGVSRRATSRIIRGCRVYFDVLLVRTAHGLIPDNEQALLHPGRTRLARANINPAKFSTARLAVEVAAEMAVAAGVVIESSISRIIRRT